VRHDHGSMGYYQTLPPAETIHGFLSGTLRARSSLFVRVGVLRAYMSLTATPALSHLFVACVGAPVEGCNGGLGTRVQG
jgi:hypothetical protein